MPSRNSPRRVVLNLIRVSPDRAVEIHRLIEIAELFGFKANAVRVAVTRLAADGLLESDERGSYRLGPAAATMTTRAEEWRKGEGRMRPWKQGWLAVALPPRPHRPTRRASLQALARLGAREGFGGLWVRPDNLRLSLDEATERLHSFGLEAGADVFVVSRLADRLASRLALDLWPVAALERSYKATLRSLERSLPKLEAMPRERSLVESFLLGGEAIRVLATDPLLPEEMLASATRVRLTETMLRYDAVGRALWRRLAVAPRLSLVHGGRHAG